MPLMEKIRNRTARVRQHRWRMRAHLSDQPHVVIGGSPRSGTTMLRRLLDRHPSLCCGPEMGLFLPIRFQLEPLSVLSGIGPDELRVMIRSSPSQGALVDAFAERYRTLQGKPRWGEKSPQNVHHFRWILERFPEARLIHVIRDGRDVVCSAREHGQRRWVDGRWVWKNEPRPIEWYARAWVADTAAGLVYRDHPQVHEVRYEDLVERPGAALDALCRFLSEPFDPVLLEPAAADGASSPADQRPVFTSSVGRWRGDLSPADQERVLAICGPRLRQLGYPE